MATYIASNPLKALSNKMGSPMFTGAPQVYGINPKTTDTNPIHALGTLGITSDGRKYRYAQAAGTEIAAGKLVIAPDTTSDHLDLAVNTAAIGDRTLSVTLGATAITGNEYEEGFLTVNDDTGEGHIHSIKSAPATSASGTVTITLHDPIEVAFAAATTVSLFRNPYRDVVISDGTLTDVPVGVTPVVVAANSYFWAQTRGVASVLIDSNDVTLGTGITIGDTGSGAVETRNAATEALVGYNFGGADNAAGEHGTFFLVLE